MRKSSISKIVAQEEASDIDLTQMLDVVFIMLIFFIVTASFIKETGIDVQRPDQNQPQVVSDEEGAILVIIDNTDDIWINNRMIDPRAVRANIERMHAEDPDRPVVIQASPDSTAESLVIVMDSSRLAGVFNISIAGGTN